MSEAKVIRPLEFVVGDRDAPVCPVCSGPPAYVCESCLACWCAAHDRGCCQIRKSVAAGLPDAVTAFARRRENGRAGP